MLVLAQRLGCFQKAYLVWFRLLWEHTPAVSSRITTYPILCKTPLPLIHGVLYYISCRWKADVIYESCGRNAGKLDLTRLWTVVTSCYSDSAWSSNQQNFDTARLEFFFTLVTVGYFNNVSELNEHGLSWKVYNYTGRQKILCSNETWSLIIGFS